MSVYVNVQYFPGPHEYAKQRVLRDLLNGYVRPPTIRSRCIGSPPHQSSAQTLARRRALAASNWVAARCVLGVCPSRGSSPQKRAWDCYRTLLHGLYKDSRSYTRGHHASRLNIYMYMYACAYVCICMCVYIYTYIYIHTQRSTRVNTCVIPTCVIASSY